MLRQLPVATLAVMAAGCAEFHSHEAILSLSAGESTRGMGELRRAAEEGKPEAQRLLASILEDGIVLKSGEAVAADPAEAAKGYQKAAEAGEREAMARLGVLHVRGRGVAKDSAKALAMLRRAGLDVDGAPRNVADAGKRALELLPPPPEPAKSDLTLSFAVDYRIR